MTIAFQARTSDEPLGADKDLIAAMNARRCDWRAGTIVYQIIVDRFVPSKRLGEKLDFYAAPRILRPWHETPARGRYLADERINEGEIEFWGGDLHSILERLDYLQELGVETLYLNPIFSAFSNHKYDANDFFAIDAQYGSLDELQSLAHSLHARGQRLILDGVLNHMGRRSELFQSAQHNGGAPDFFYFGSDYRHGYRSWRNSANLPEVNLENPDVRRLLFDGPDSVVRHYIRCGGVDGWRLDVAPDVGFHWLSEITRAAHEECPGTVVIGECWNYPDEWLGVLDGIMNMHMRELLLAMSRHEFSARSLARIWDRLIAECDYDGLLRSHMVLDNHDVPRLATLVPDSKMRALLRVLQFTLPGSPVIYYGSELGMQGGRDPENRAPMRWDLLGDWNEDLRLVKDLVRLRQENPALRVGNMRVLDAERLFAFLRLTDRATEAILVLANPTEETVREIIPVRYSRLMDASPVRCLLTGEELVLHSGSVTVTLPPRSVRLFRTVDRGQGVGGYTMYKRVP